MLDLVLLRVAKYQPIAGGRQNQGLVAGVLISPEYLAIIGRISHKLQKIKPSKFRDNHIKSLHQTNKVQQSPPSN
jgi:hypothetical protein